MSPPEKVKILFLCTGNSCRSQMAEGWARALRSDFVEPYSAGIETHGLNPDAVRVMAEAGVDISGQRSKPVSELRDVPFDYVVTVCGHAHENCPVFPGRAKVIHVGFDDPPRLAANARTEEERLAPTAGCGMRSGPWSRHYPIHSRNSHFRPTICCAIFMSCNSRGLNLAPEQYLAKMPSMAWPISVQGKAWITRQA